MKAFMTNGTLDYLQKITSTHKSLDLHLMHNGSGTLAYYETAEKSIFEAGRVYEIILTSRAIQDEGYVVMINIPLTEEGKPIFIDRFRRRINKISLMPGFQAFRLLKSVRDNTYIVFSQWATKADFEKWKDSEDFLKSHDHHDIKQPAYFAARPFSIKYIMIDDEEL